MDLNEIEILSQKAETFLSSASALIGLNDYESSVSRAYYSMFYLAQAALLSKGLDAGTHTGVNQLFGQYFIKTEIFPKELGRYLSYAAQRRSVGDYGIYERISLEMAKDLIHTATFFNQHIKNYLAENGYLTKEIE